MERTFCIAMTLTVLAGCSDESPLEPGVGAAQPIEPGVPADLRREFEIIKPEVELRQLGLYMNGALDAAFQWSDNFSRGMAVGRPVDSRLYLICIVDRDVPCDWAAVERRYGVLSNQMGGGLVPHAVYITPHFSSQLVAQTADDTTYYTFADDGPERKCLDHDLALTSQPETFYVAVASCLERAPYEAADSSGLYDCIEATNRYAVTFSTPIGPTPPCQVKSP